MKPRSASTRQPMNKKAPETAETDSSFSEGVLSWGSSVTVNEDHNRNVRREIQAIDATNDTLQSNIKNEDRTSTQLAKDFSHARAEMVQLHRAAADEHDSATLKNQVRAKLKASLKSDLLLASPVSVVSTDSTAAPELANEQDNATTNEEDEAAGQPQNTASFLKQRVVELHDLGVAFTKEKEALLDLQAEKVDLQRQSRAVGARMEADKLLEAVDAVKAETATSVQHKAAEERRRRSAKEAVQKVRVQCGHHAQQIADQTKLLNAKKAKNEQQEVELALRLKEMEERLASDESSKAIESELASTCQELDQLNQKLQAFDDLHAERTAIATQRATTKQETQQLRTFLEEFQPKLQDIRSKQAAAQGRLKQSKALRASVNAQRAENDKIHTDKVLPGQTEKNSIVLEKEELAKSMNELHEESVSAKTEADKRLVGQSETLNKLEHDAKVVKGEATEQHAKKESIKKEHEQLDETTQKELKEHRDYGINHAKATTVEKKRAEAAKAEHKRERKERIEEAREECAKAKSDFQSSLEAWRHAVDMISTTLELENQ